jgi:exopolysaccharide biosynthesis polyprenyl glycosylphosphotransferase
MLREHLRTFKKLLFAADLSLVALGFRLAAIIGSARHGHETSIFASDDQLLPALLIWGLVFWYQPRCYSFRLRKTSEVLLSSLKASLISSGIFLAFIYVLGSLGHSRAEVVLFAVLSIFLIMSFRLTIVSLLHFYRTRGYNYQTVLIVGTGKVARDFADKVLNYVRHGLKILGFLDWERRPGLWRYRDIPCIGYLQDLPEILKRNQVDFVVFAVGKKHLETIEQSLQICEEMGVRVSVLADFFIMRLAKRRIDSFFDSPMVSYDPTPSTNLALITKNFLDIALASLGLILASPIMCISALAIKITSHGPVIFKQPRCGLNGRRFTIYKFRTMVEKAEEMKKDLMRFNEIHGAAFKMKNDPRITSVGRFLRKTSIDELPQLFNILRGDMSFVGPRPPLADEVARYDLWQRRKLSMKPGLTCLWQIRGRSDVPFDQWMKLDLEYIDNWSLLKDAEILVKTVPAVLKGTGAR